MRMRACKLVRCLHSPSRSWQLPLSGRESAKKHNYNHFNNREVVQMCSCKKLLQDHTWNQNSQVDFDNVELLAYAKLFPAAILSVNSTSSFFTICLTICRLATRAIAISANFWSQEDELHHVGLGDQLEDDDGCWRSEFCGSTKCSAQ